MRGPMLNYKLGKITHEEYEVEASQYWRRNEGQAERMSLAERVQLALGQAVEAVNRARCAAPWTGLSPARCGPVT